jgi:hypothetical protein
MVHVISQMKKPQARYYNGAAREHYRKVTEGAWKAFYLLCQDPIWSVTKEEAQKAVNEFGGRLRHAALHRFRVNGKFSKVRPQTDQQKPFEDFEKSI